MMARAKNSQVRMPFVPREMSITTTRVTKPNGVAAASKRRNRLEDDAGPFIAVQGGSARSAMASSANTRRLCHRFGLTGKMKSKLGNCFGFGRSLAVDRFLADAAN